MLRSCTTLLGIVAFAAGTPLTARILNQRNSTNQTTASSFADVPITSDIQWTPCYDTFSCLRLEVPLDYEELGVGTTDIAFLKFAATAQPAKGDLLLNPGGPANSANAGWFQDLLPILGTSWNLVAMDPRGVNNSGPAIECFPDTYTRDFYYKYQGLSELDTKDPVLRRNYWTLTGALGDWCSSAVNDIVKYVNTPATARDLLHYAEKLAEREGKAPEEAKVNYYGVSYGTILGSTFARLYPDRLGRFVLDGVADIEDYYSGAWLVGIDQADEALGSFFTYCFEAGPLCKFFRNDTSAAAMQERFDIILTDLEQNPIPISDSKLTQYPYIIDHMDLRGAVFSLLYKYMTGFPVLDQIITNLEHRNDKKLAETMTLYTDFPKGVVPSEKTHVAEYDPTFPRMAISCNDMNKRRNISSPEQFDEYNERTVEVSKYFGWVWSGLIPTNCRKWQSDLPESQVFPGIEQTETNNPILWLSNKLDPVSFAHEKMAAFFPGSRILIQDAVGHGVPQAFSNCTSGHVQNFLETGELPPEGLVCPVDIGPFDPENPYF